MNRKTIDKYIKPMGGCIKCAKCTHIRTSFFCGNKKLTNRQLYNEKGYCSKFVPKCGAKMERGEKMDDLISRQVESNPLEKCYTCKHVYQRVSDADTLYCRCRKGCRYEEFKPKRSNNDSGRHED